MSSGVDIKLSKLGISVIRVAQRRFQDLADEIPSAITKTLRAEAEYLAGAMRQRFDKVRPANSRITKFLKGSSKPLVGLTGDLRNSIAAVEEDDGTFYIGIPEDSDGAKLAMIHEKGVTIVQHMTDKQRRFIHAVLPEATGKEKLAAHGRALLRSENGQASTGIIVIHIPARPFIEPTFRSESKLIPKRFSEGLMMNLGLHGGEGGRL